MPPNIFSDSKDTYNAKVKTTLDNLTKPSSNDNPPFIWPGPTTHDLSTLDGKYKPLRGYIRRLNEFYKKMGVGSSNINNRKCNFQFQPETVVRNVAGNSYDTQYFFNQDPGQLTVPIPGQSTFNIKLLFNREAEVSRNQYLSADRKIINGSKNPSPTINDNTDSLFIEGTFNQSWVTKIGVLADILVLDAVIGQGINEETVSIIKKIAEDAKAAASKNKAPEGATLTDRQLDAQDKNAFTEAASTFWTGAGGANPNLGNQAFLVPTPIRIVLSNNMMVEGFVLQSAVNFHKFSRNFIPTQATVELSVQALYIGFSKQTTMLTAELPTDENGPDASTSSTELTETQKAITEGLNSLYKQGTITSSFEGKDLLDLLLTTEPTKELGFSWNTTPAGYQFVLDTLVPLTGGAPEWFWEGQIAMYWDSYVDGAPTPRGLLRTSAGGGQVKKGFPPSSTLQQWGKTSSTPLIIATGSGAIRVTEFQENAGTGFKVYGHTIKREVTPWSLNLPDGLTVPKPYEEDKFTVVVAINIKVDVRGTFFDVGQIVSYKNTVAAGDNVLFNKGFNFISRVQE